MIGDHGRSRGPLQIQRGYWRDSRTPGRYLQVHDPQYAARVVVNYWRRHCPTALARGNAEVLARTHNGGPNGPHMSATRKYWLKVRRCLR